MNPKITSARIEYGDGTVAIVRLNEDGESYRYSYWSPNDEPLGSWELVARNDHNSGVWAAMLAVAAMVNPAEAAE